jgi:2-amino-4-hydroxy-6-hydroxymethyldihydropteridine diphosphokinase / dihydropteroate synthase
MLVLGLGSNLGDSLNNLRCAVQSINQSGSVKITAISNIYSSDALLPEGADLTWRKPFLNMAVLCQTKLDPFDLLAVLQTIESRMGRPSCRQRWAPRIIDIDILAWGHRVLDHAQLRIPHPQLRERPFALWPLLDVTPDWQHPFDSVASKLESWGLRTENNAPFRTRQIPHRIDIPALVGIVNVTPDSFSGDGCLDAELAVQKAQMLFDSGAQIIDLGAQSTRPGAKCISPELEWERLEPVLKGLNKLWRETFAPKISIDTYHPETAQRAISLGVDWINDVGGLTDLAMQRILLESGKTCVWMHHLSIPADPNQVIDPHVNVVQTVMHWARSHLDKLLDKGIRREQLIFDPGIGFGKTAIQSQVLLNNMRQLKFLDLPILIGHSRKSFLKKETIQDKDAETVKWSLRLASSGVDYLRVHHVALNQHALRQTLTDSMSHAMDCL